MLLIGKPLTLYPEALYLLLRAAFKTQAVVTSVLTFERLTRTNLMMRRPLRDIQKPPPRSINNFHQQELNLC